MTPPMTPSVSRAARLVALSRIAQEDSIAAIRRSRALLRQPAYPDARAPAPTRRG
jgi:hypothetical protein